MTTEAPAVEPAPAAAPANAVPEVNPTAELPAEQQPPEKTFTQKELDEILEKRLAKERRKREELNRRLAVTEELALRSRPKDEPKPSSGEDPEPERDNFENYELYSRALARWEGRQAYREERTKEREESERTKTQEEKRKLARTFQEHAAKVKKDIADFDEVMESSEAPMTDAMAAAIMSADEMGPKLAYHLAKHPEEAERIASLPVPRQAAEMGKLEVKLSTPETEPKTPSKAPAPIKPVGGKGGPSDEMPKDTDDIKTWMSKEAKRLRKK